MRICRYFKNDALCWRNKKRKGWEVRIFFCFYFFLFLFLFLRRGRRLDVVGLQVALEIQDLQLIRLRQREELAQRRIGLDDLLHHQRVGLRVGADTGRDLRAGEQSALGNAQERTERVRDGRGLSEDRLLLGSGDLTLRELDRTAAATLGGALQLARHLLLELLDIGEQRAESRAQSVDLLYNGIDLRDDIDLLHDGSSSRSGRLYVADRGDRRRSRSRNRNRRNDWRDDGRNGSSDSGNSRGGRRGLLGGTLGGRGGGRHLSYVVGRGSFTGIQTRECLLSYFFWMSQFCSPEARKRNLFSRAFIYSKGISDLNS